MASVVAAVLFIVSLLQGLWIWHIVKPPTCREQDHEALISHDGRAELRILLRDCIGFQNSVQRVFKIRFKDSGEEVPVLIYDQQQNPEGRYSAKWSVNSEVRISAQGVDYFSYYAPKINKRNIAVILR